jgi:hypothetical protein
MVLAAEASSQNMFESPYDAALTALYEELRALYKVREKIDADKAKNDAAIANCETASRALRALLGGPALVSNNGAGLPKAHPFASLSHPPDYAHILKGIGKQGYGVVSGAVAALLEAEPEGFSARDLVEILTKNGIRLNGEDKEMAVRSAIKNLRIRGRAVYDSETSRYRTPHVPPAPA